MDIILILKESVSNSRMTIVPNTVLLTRRANGLQNHLLAVFEYALSVIKVIT
jgi:hypothetical protein